MSTGKPTAKLSYVAIMLLAGGCLLLYVVKSGSKTPPSTPNGNSATQTPRKGPSPDAVLVAGDAEAIKKGIAAGMDVNTPLTVAPFVGLSPLQVAAVRGIAGGIPVLAAAGANVDAQTADGRTSLMMASQGGNATGVAELLSANASIDIRDSKGTTALMLAAGAGKAEAVQLLLKAGASVNAADQSGATAVAHAAAVSGNAAVVQILITGGADPNLADAQGVTPLMKAAERADSEQVVLLLNEGASPTGKSQDGRSALDRAKQRSDEAGKVIAGVLGQAG